jgi:hypothetical protein
MEILIMPRAMGFRLTRKLAAVTTGGVMLAIANLGQLPAQAEYSPPLPASPSPGGYVSVVTSRTFGPSGGVIGMVAVGGFRVRLRVPRGAFSVPVQVTITAPDVLAIGSGGHQGYRALGGVGVLLQADGTTYVKRFARPLVLTVYGRAIRADSRVAVWKGTRFAFEASRESRAREVIAVRRGTEQDFVILAPVRARLASATRSSRGHATAASRPGEAVLTSVFLSPAGQSTSGIGVLAPGLRDAGTH